MLNSSVPHDWREKPRAERLRLLRSLRMRKPLAKMSLREFTESAWPIIDPAITFVDNWHIGAICDHLEAVFHGEIKNLLINIPPGCMKSSLTCVLWPTWGWTRAPEKRWLFASYSQNLSIRDSLRSRHIIESDWYQNLWGHNVVIGDDQNTKMRFENTQRGWRMATTIGGAATGEHPDFVIVDDPISAKKVESEKERQAVIDWWDGTISTRGRSRDVRKVIIMQRLGFDDLSGHVLRKQEERYEEGADVSSGDWVHLCLPMRYEPRVMVPNPLGFVDPRDESLGGEGAGGLLWPGLFNEQSVTNLEYEFGGPESPRTAGQLQQRPPDVVAGSEWPASYFAKDKIWCDELHALHDRAFVVSAWDPSLGASDKSDYSAGITLSLGFDGSIRVKANIRRRDVQSLCEAICDDVAENDPQSVGLEANGFQRLIEPLLSLEAKRRGLGVPTALIYNTTMSKRERVRSITGYLARGEIQVVRDADGELLVKQLRAFPNGSHDDGPDALEQAIRLVRSLWAESNR